MDIFLALILVLLVSFLSNVSPFFGASYTLFATLQLGLVGFTPLSFALIALVSAAGATIAKVVIYYGAFGLRGLLGKNRNVQLIGRNASTRKFYLILFATAFLPVLPLDDFIYIGAGANAASIGPMAGVTLAAKTAKSAVEIAVEFMILKDFGRALGFQTPEVAAAVVIVFLVAGIGFYKIDWEKLYARIRGQPDTESGTGRTRKKPL